MHGEGHSDRVASVSYHQSGKTVLYKKLKWWKVREKGTRHALLITCPRMNCFILRFCPHLQAGTTEPYRPTENRSFYQYFILYDVEKGHFQRAISTNSLHTSVRGHAFSCSSLKLIKNIWLCLVEHGQNECLTSRSCSFLSFPVLHRTNLRNASRGIEQQTWWKIRKFNNM